MARRAVNADLPMSEAQFQRRVLDTAELFGLRCHHARPAQTGRGWRTAISGSAGYPDVTMVEPGRLLIVELKAEAGAVRPEQRQWLDLLATVRTVEVHLWRPSDWPTALSVLSGGRAEERPA
jgi:hypothetical protein